MTKAELIAILERHGIAKSSDQTIPKTYSDSPFENSVLRAVDGNRLQSGWKKAAYVIAKHDDSNKPIEEYLEGWKTVVGDYTDQFLCLEFTEDNWRFFDYKGDEISLDDLFPAKKQSVNTFALQKIFFGTPGSGKSHMVQEIVAPFKNDTFRTTFHPDSDYASFVGSYKPVVNTTGITVPTTYSLEQLAAMLKQEYKDSTDKVVTLHSFTLKYVGYFNGQIADFNKKAFLNEASLAPSYDAEINKMVNLYQWMVDNEMISKENSISYEFVPQAFTDAYVAAWKDTTKPVYLVIEEINRGNCAQIFGDLFQLLDRGENGKSEYSIKADKDLCKYLESDKGLGKGHEGIKNGELCLPGNLRIYATMNTSDQSLFPMDSAFKRRWEWEYVPIDPENPDSQFVITIADKKYAWKDFLLAANERVKDVSESEDKQMGNFFIKDHISKDEFVSKVMFYLWSEVCKDEYRARSFFHYKDGNNDEFSFNELFQKDENGVKKDVALLQGFMSYLGVKEL